MDCGSSVRLSTLARREADVDALAKSDSALQGDDRGLVVEVSARDA
jgi:hypothetical protein